MTWFRIDDGFYDHPKVVALLEEKHGAAAIGFWTVCGSWCAKYETNGSLPASVARRLGVSRDATALLVSHGLWERTTEGNFQFHDWLSCNPSKKELEEKREKTRKRVTAHREKHSGAASSNALHDALPSAEKRDGTGSLPIPSHPFPSQSSPHPPAECDALGVRPANDQRPPIRPEPFESDPWTAERAALDFRAAFLERYGTEPSMGGKSVAGLAERVATTAQRRGLEPRALFAEVLRKWLLKPRTDVERRAPYACFAQAWGELTMPAEAGRDVSRGYVASRDEDAYASQRAANAAAEDDLVFEGQDVPWET